MLGLVTVFDLSAAPPARHVTVMMVVMVVPVCDEPHEVISLLHAPKWCQTVAP